MRRVPAILLVFLFSFPLIAPALFPDAQSNLPACCRRDGKHHCGMLAPDTAQIPSSGAAVEALHAKCRLFPDGGAVLPHSEAALLAASPRAYLQTVISIAVTAQVEAGYRLSCNRAHQKRGPPALLS